MAGSRVIVKMDKPHMAPHTCARCGVGEEAKRDFYLDIGVNYDFEGNVYLCNVCLTDIAKASGIFLSKEEVDELISVQSEMVQQASEIKNDWSGLVGWAKTLGLDLELLKKNFKETDEHGIPRISPASDSKTDGTNGSPLIISGITFQ